MTVSKNPNTSDSKHVTLVFRCLWVIGLLVLGALLSLPISHQAHAAAPKPVMLSQSGLVTGEHLTLGDVFTNVPQKLQGHILAHAPAPGKTMTLSPFDLERIRDAFDLEWSNLAGKSLALRRNAQDIRPAVLKQKLSAALSHDVDGKFDLVLPQDFHWTIDGLSPYELVVETIDYQPLTRLSHANVSIQRDGQTLAERQLKLAVVPLAEVPMPIRPLRNGDIITKRDLRWVTMPLADISDMIVIDPEDVLGQSPRRSLAPNKPIKAVDLEAPTLVERGDIVTITLKNGPISLATRVRALHDGAMSDWIQVMHPDSRKIIDAKVIGLQRVALPMTPDKLAYK